MSTSQTTHLPYQFLENKYWLTIFKKIIQEDLLEGVVCEKEVSAQSHEPLPFLHLVECLPNTEGIVMEQPPAEHTPWSYAVVAKVTVTPLQSYITSYFLE